MQILTSESVLFIYIWFNLEMQLCEGEEEDTQCCFFNETFPSSK